MLDSPRLTSASIAVRRDPQTVEDLRSTTVIDDPVQRRDLILIERARSGDLDAFNDLVVLYQDSLFALVVRMVPDRDQASDCVQEAFFSAYRNLSSFRGGSVKSWLNRICVNAAMDTQRARKRRPVQPYPEFEDESWQPPAGEEVDPERIAVHAERSRAIAMALARITDDQRAAIVLYDVEGYDYEILKMIDFSRTMPAIIRFEHQHLPRADWNAAISLLVGTGYRILEEPTDTTAYRADEAAGTHWLTAAG